MSKTTLGSYWRFLLAGVFNQGQTGAVVPSQRFLIERMIEPIPADYRGQIIELGAGTGALTQRLAARCPYASVVACEINAVLAKITQNSLTAAGLNDRVQLVSGAAEQVLSRIWRGEMKQPEFILSGQLPSCRYLLRAEVAERCESPSREYRYVSPYLRPGLKINTVVVYNQTGPICTFFQDT
jgi:hypothetical protein